jgi:prolyl oligopeptidase
MNLVRGTAALFVLAITACSAAQKAPARAAATPGAAGAQLKDVGERYWTALLESRPLTELGQNGIGYLGGPLYATSLGDHRFDDKLDDLSDEARTRLLAKLAALRDEAARIPEGALSEEERISLAILLRQLDDARQGEACRTDAWLVDAQGGPQVQLAQAAMYAALETPKGAADLAARYAQAGRYFGQSIGGLRAGLQSGITAPRADVVRVIEQLDAMIALGPDAEPLLPPEPRFAKLPEAQRGPARAAVRKQIAEQVLPALQSLRGFLSGELLPRARDDAHAGLWALPFGADCYAFLIAHHTGTTKTPQELHELGLAELARIEDEQRAIAKAEGAPADKDGNVDLRAFTASLARRPDQFKRTGEELLKFNQDLLARAMAALPRAFPRLPPRAVEVRAVEAYRAPSFAVGYYQPAPDDGSQLAIYYVNLYKPETRALYNNEALLFHEAVPGHHLQGAIMQDLAGLPDYRRQFGQTAYIEGWALYSEQMSDETLHLYSGAPARFGMLGYQGWRASRLVVDTGLHALRWDRARAVRFLVEHTTLPQGEAESEIDRYLATPGQALGYMIGKLELYRLRGEAQARLGDRFDLKQFHSIVLEHGAIPIDVVGRLVGDWIERTR